MPADAHVPGILPAGEGAAHHEEVRLPQESVGGELLERTDVRNLKAEATSLRHLMTHFPKNPHCSACMRAKMCAKSAPVRKHDPDDAPSKSGEQFTADHIIAQDVVDESVLGDRTALIVLDRATKWMDAFPLLTKSALDTANALQDFLVVSYTFPSR